MNYTTLFPAETVMTLEMIDLPGDSALTRLRAEQDRVFFN